MRRRTLLVFSPHVGLSFTHILIPTRAPFLQLCLRYLSSRSRPLYSNQDARMCHIRLTLQSVMWSHRNSSAFVSERFFSCAPSSPLPLFLPLRYKLDLDSVEPPSTPSCGPPHLLRCDPWNCGLRNPHRLSPPVPTYLVRPRWYSRCPS